eukprot:CAMPEP_0171988518 /NCGR_PEP_ID=MMETSP0993-20121228/275944_1 /TAXON_ID=483369 /ORGANISM="non described non described, Strain CCMP2098" /LENGTH=269 /DNA_ID=CAMNT_0012641493 /DNA_START=719 /DNA_END=1528 /DNA_ORIENTATION=-
MSEAREAREELQELRLCLARYVATPVHVEGGERVSAAGVCSGGGELDYARVGDLHQAKHAQELQLGAVRGHVVQGGVVAVHAPRQVQGNERATAAAAQSPQSPLMRSSPRRKGQEIRGALLSDGKVAFVRKLRVGVKVEALQGALEARAQESEACVAQKRAARKVEVCQGRAMAGNGPACRVFNRLATAQVEQGQVRTRFRDFDQARRPPRVVPVQLERKKARTARFGHRDHAVVRELVQGVEVEVLEPPNASKVSVRYLFAELKVEAS